MSLHSSSYVHLVSPPPLLTPPQGASTTVVGSKMYLFVSHRSSSPPRLSDPPPGWSSRHRATHGLRPLCLRSRYFYLGENDALSGRRCPPTPLLSQCGNMHVSVLASPRLLISFLQGTTNLLSLVEWEMLPILLTQRTFVFSTTFGFLTCRPCTGSPPRLPVQSLQMHLSRRLCRNLDMHISLL